MVRLVILVLVAVAVMAAYPWVAVAAGAVVAAGLVSAAVRGRARRNPLPEGRGSDRALGKVEVSLDRRLALKAAWDEIHRIERSHGIPPSGSAGGDER